MLRAARAARPEPCLWDFQAKSWGALLFPPLWGSFQPQKGTRVARSAGWAKERSETKKARFHELIVAETMMALRDLVGKTYMLVRVIR